MRKEAENNWAQARADLATAVTLRDAGVYYASVFFAQQSAEKALRAANMESLNKNPKGHNLIAMANNLNAPIEIMNFSAELNADFLNTRSPEAADGIPFQLYTQEDAILHLQAAQEIVEWVRNTYISMY
ncbi:MAG: HEPN domain-containing protein [Armatimonadetes bacterium]|nr:HEPN domain-containing protein [Armatimonadota bacterium]